MNGPPLLEGRDLRVVFGARSPAEVVAVDGVDLTLEPGARVAVVGESGSGKSTLARALLRLVPLERGQVLLRGEDLAVLTAEELRRRRRDLQMIFQDPLASLDPRMRVVDIVAEPLELLRQEPSAAARRERALALLETVGIPASSARRLPREFSGGQAQRIAIARALICDPAVLLCDEPVSALDLATRGNVLRLLEAQAAQRGLALVFISHDLAAVRYLCDQVRVIFRGRIVEQADRATLFAHPRHPYTRALLAAVPVPDPVIARARRVGSTVAGATASGSGCAYSARCPFVIDRCRIERPLLRSVEGSQVACHRAEEIARA
ncbi:MAG: oligopeptide/dipeptide ABC transporter ATP-binding protein [Steroidobacteraceae bacterium]